MSRRLLDVRPDDDVRLAARPMTEAEVHRLLVLDECGAGRISPAEPSAKPRQTRGGAQGIVERR